MKTCPVCHAVAFDDAETCFGCLYSFADGTMAATQSSPRKKRPRHEPADSGTTILAPVGGSDFPVPYEDEVETVEVLDVPYDYVPAEGERASPAVRRMDTPLQGMLPFTFQVSITPVVGNDGNWTWSCAVGAVRQ